MGESTGRAVAVSLRAAAMLMLAALCTTLLALSHVSMLTGVALASGRMPMAGSVPGPAPAALRSWLEAHTAGLRTDPLVQQGPKLSAEGPSFGASVALSADGDTALVGAAGDNEGRGAAWVFTRTGETWSQQGGELTGAGESGAGEFGASVALSGDGDTALIGATGDDDHKGAAWVFTRTGSTWTQQGEKLTGSGEVGEGWFGRSVALSQDGNTALVGAFHDNDTLGAAWAFVRTGETWGQQGEKLVGGGGCGTPFLGSSVALSADGNTALIGAAWDCDVGAAWVFTRSGSTWSQQGEKLRASGEVGKGFFGESVALSVDGNSALMGAPSDADGRGAAWVFTRSGSTWTQQGAKLTGGGEIGEGHFGRSVAISGEGDTALIGGGYENTGDNGAAWLFTSSGATWTQQGEKLSGSGEDDEEGALGRLGGGGFGASVALSADAGTALVGGGHGSGLLGAAWVFVEQPHATAGGAEYGRCVLVTRVSGEHYRGRYSAPGCTKKGKHGRYEWYSGVARTHFTSRLTRRTAVLESVRGTRVTCSGEMGVGEYSGAGLTTVGGVVLDFTGCEGLGQKCSSPQAAPGEITTAALEGTLGMATRQRSAAGSAVALDLAPAGGAGVFAAFSCGATSVAFRGSLVGAVSGNHMGPSSTLSFLATKGVQALQSLVGGPARTLEASFDGGPFERIGLKLVTTLVNEEAMEARSASH